MRKVAAPALIPLFLLVACGGGGSSDLGTSSSSSSPSTQVIASAAPNVVTIEVDAGPAALTSPSFNTAFVTLTVCQPGSTTNCETIPDIAVDTGSYGLRLVYGALSTSFAATLPQQMAGTLPVAECAVFAIGYSWGSVRSADVTISGETASSLPIQMIGDPAFPNVPTDCSSNVPPEQDTVATFGANGILGIGQFVQDCPECATQVVPSTYYTCPSNGSTCTGVIEPISLQVANPVASFAADNNGVIVELPSVSDGGAESATGALVFGIGTESNNGLSGATVLTSNPSTSGSISVSFNGVTYPESFLDSGSNAFYFVDSSIPTCGSDTVAPGFFCPTATQSLTAQLIGANAANVTSSFQVENAVDLATDNPTATAFPDIGAPNSDTQSFDFGIVFFYGRNVFVAIDGASTPGGTGPYFAY